MYSDNLQISVAEVGMLAATAQISLGDSAERAFANFCDKNTVSLNCKFLQHKRRFLQLQVLVALRLR